MHGSPIWFIVTKIMVKFHLGGLFMRRVIRWGFFLVGIMIFSMGISLTIQVQHLGIHPWDVLTVGLYERFGLTIGT